MSLWEQFQLALLRILTVTLGVVDGLLNVRWGQRMLDRLARRWQTRLEQLDDAMAALEQERNRTHRLTEALAVQTAAIYLGGRSLVDEELIFDPAIPRDEEILDAAIELLVKRRLATIEPKELEEEHYVYNLEPDWAAIHAHLVEVHDEADPDLAGWLQEGAKFIQESFLSSGQNEMLNHRDTETTEDLTV
jgi:hypothetical protein